MAKHKAESVMKKRLSRRMVLLLYKLGAAHPNSGAGTRIAASGWLTPYLADALTLEAVLSTQYQVLRTQNSRFI
jgi:hypothetical protein